ncbi:TonB-dependent receptor domain-containing protein [Flavobacterium sp.]|uniref:TonB-dependent receptor n=1 Tax=Flavobacterium sp. TaxID=239 RepID=UPI0028BD529F|nr:TonB-dependent receptor [Flavobacterium sp.]
MKTLFKTVLVVSCLQMSVTALSQEVKVQDSVKVNELEEVVVSSVRAGSKQPVTFTNMSKQEIAPRNLGQDIPVLMNYLPSVVSTTDAGNGVGYTSMRVRGADGSRINVTLNGIPFNDSESQGTFFVNLPDFASSLESLQLQRGVGTSTNGAGAFGASLNMQTKAYQEKAYAEIANSFGSFATRKHTLSFGTGLHDNFEFNGRLSQLNSDGYIDRATSQMFGYFFNANYVTEKTLVKLIAFGGKERTYQAWYGLEDPEKLQNDRTFNPAGMYFDADGTMRFYDNESDNYWQNHFQLHWSQKWTSNWTSNAALHYTLGKGYYEQYKEDEAFADYGLATFGGNTITDLVRRRWLDNDFFGATFSMNYTTANATVIFGGAANRYLGDHYGEVIWTQYYTPDFNRYYSNYGNKDDVNFYAKATQKINDKISAFADMQYRLVYYQATGVQADDVNDTFRFFNPKVGLNYQLNAKNAFYAYFGVANKEPRRDDYENGSTKPERLFDYELGWRYEVKDIRMNVNAFYMNYKDQLVMTGALNDVGAPVFTNSGKSYRVGLEADVMVKPHEKWTLSGNVTVSQNKNKDFYFQRDGELKNLGNTDIAFSPSLITASNVTFSPVKALQMSLLGKYVGKQYMGNIDSEQSALEAYNVCDFNANYEWKLNKGLKSVVFTALVNNIFNKEYESNGYFYTYDDDWSNPGSVTTIEGAGFYPQAGINFLAGVTLKF